MHPMECADAETRDFWPSRIHIYIYLMLFTFGGFVCRDAPLLTLVDDPESTKQAPLPRMLVCRVKDHDGAVPEPFKLDEVIAIKVTLYAEGTRAA